MSVTENVAFGLQMKMVPKDEITRRVEEAIYWLDNICVAASTERLDTAVHFMNYLLDAENEAANTNFTYFASPNEAAAEFIEAEVLDDPSIYPPEEVLGRLEWLVEVGDAVFLYDEMWTAIKGQ